MLCEIGDYSDISQLHEHSVLVKKGETLPVGIRLDARSRFRADICNLITPKAFGAVQMATGFNDLTFGR